MNARFSLNEGEANPAGERATDVAGALSLAEWTTLARLATEPNIFYAPTMLIPALAYLGGGNAPELFCHRDEQGTLVGLMPVTGAARYRGMPLRYRANWRHSQCFLGTPLVAPGHEEGFWKALLAHLDARGGAILLRLERITEDGPAAQALAKHCRSTGRPFHMTRRTERAFLQSDDDVETYTARFLRGKKRKELRRQQRRLEELGELKLVRQADDAQLEPWIDEFLELEAGGWKGAAGTALALDDAEACFFRESLRRCASTDALERLALRLDGRAIAMLVNLHSPPGAFGFKTAFDEDYARFSPGVLLQLENLRLLERPELDWTDSCAAQDHPMIDHIWAERRSVVTYHVAIGGPLRRSIFAVLNGFETMARHIRAIISKPRGNG